VAGASAVQMTSAIFTYWYAVIDKTLSQLEKYLEQKNINTTDLIGLAADLVTTYAEQDSKVDHWRKFTPE